jgi:sugar lactone lactonase YvrE
MRVLALIALAACGSSNPAPDQPAPPVAPPVVAAPAVGMDIPLPGGANGLYWDSADHALYFADDVQTSLMRWAPKDGFTVVAPLPAGKSSYGGVTRLKDGTFLIASFGFGTDGAVLAVDAKHAVTSVPNLDKLRRRVGITSAPDGTIYDVYFIVNGHDHTGGLAKLDIATGETDVTMPNLVKPVGVAATANGVYVSDQETNVIYALRGGAISTFASNLQSADLLTVLPDGSLVTGGKTGVVQKVGLDGRVTVVAQGYDQVRGTAYDPDTKRLFVVDHSKDLPHKLHVVIMP